MTILYFILFIALGLWAERIAKSWVKGIVKEEAPKEPVPVAYKNGHVVYKD